MQRSIRCLFAGICFILAACNPMANLDAGEAKVAQFQKSYSSGDYDRLYGMTSPKFQQITSREQFQELVDLFDARLGRIVSSERSGFNVNTNNGVTTTVISMTTEFAQGEGIETYTFHGHGDGIALVGWNVTSPRLALSMDDIKKLNEAEASE